MNRHLPRVAQLAAAFGLVVGLAVSPLGSTAVLADSNLSITGNVVGAAGNLGGIGVGACTTDWSFCSDYVHTDETGSFALTGLVSGEYKIEIDGTPTYLWGYYVAGTVAWDYWSATPIELTDTNVNLADIQLVVGSHIYGTVTGRAGNLAGIEVSACNMDFGCSQGSVDASGSYSVSGLAPGTYQLGFRDNGQTYVSGLYSGSTLTPNPALGVQIDMTGGDVTLPSFELPLGVATHGTLTGSAGHLQDLEVDAISDNDQWSYYQSANTDENGNFTIGGLYPGDYMFCVEDYSGTYVGGCYTDSGLVEAETPPYAVGPDGLTLPTVQLQLSSSISGTVSGSADPSALIINACSLDSGLCRESGVDADGNFDVSRLSAGRYTISLHDWSGTVASGYYSDSGTLVPSADQATIITVPPSVSGLQILAVPAVAPDAPTGVVAAPGDSSATLSWTAPINNGGAPIFYYMVYASDGMSSCYSTSTSCTVSGLTNGQSYYFTVTASNTVGTSAPSARSNRVTPVASPVQTAAKFGISAPATATAGDNLTVEVSALDQDGNVVTGYTGTVGISSSDLRAILPADYTFTAADGGVHDFTVSLVTAGAQLVDAGDGSLIGAEAAVTVNPGPAAQLVVNGPATATAGVGQNYMITAVDAFGNVATGNADTIRVNSSDARFGAAPRLVTLVNGVGTFKANFRTAGMQSIKAVDKANRTIVGSLGGIQVRPAKAAAIVITGMPAKIIKGVATTVTVSAVDRFSNVATGYVGTVHFRSNDRAAVLPADFTFTAADAGVHTFTVTLKTAGNRWVMVRDTKKHSIGGKVNVQVLAKKPQPVH